MATLHKNHFHNTVYFHPINKHLILKILTLAFDGTQAHTEQTLQHTLNSKPKHNTTTLAQGTGKQAHAFWGLFLFYFLLFGRLMLYWLDAVVVYVRPIYWCRCRSLIIRFRHLLNGNWIARLAAGFGAAVIANDGPNRVWSARLLRAHTNALFVPHPTGWLLLSLPFPRGKKNRSRCWEGCWE